MKRSTTYRLKWNRLVSMYGTTCYYCGEHATCIDHIIPMSYGGGDNIENLVLACAFCNLTALDKVFNDVDEKSDYIRRKRIRSRRRTRAICVECLLPYHYRVHSSSLFLCPECLDAEYGEGVSQSKSWRQWLKTLTTAQYPVVAHRETGREVRLLMQYKEVLKAERYRILWNYLFLDDEKAYTASQATL